MNYGTEYPEQIDVISIEGGCCKLFVIQANELGDEEVLKLQEKLNNYLSYILDGQLAAEYPDRAAMPKAVALILQHQPKGLAFEFLSRVGVVFEENGIDFGYEVRAT